MADISGWLTAAATVAGVIGTAGAAFVQIALSTRDQRIASLASGQKILFDKLDAAVAELHAYKLHVAETYVNEAKLEKLLDPINRRLENIENDLRRKNPGA